MSYQSLARKYRPKSFQDLMGQDAVTAALTNAIRLQRIPPTIIFTGVRGIGKTTLARLYAKALNCQNGPTAEPCERCDSCLAIAAGNHEDVLEIDGASNTSVDDVRALQETVGYKPQRSKYKVYIIDEVHMLSQSAFNALLKTLEEPPSDVIFVFATTEFQKIPKTIVGRCQTFHLQKLSLETIVKRLRNILTWENIPFEDDAVLAVAREGQGSMRDALTFLDQAIAIGGGNLTQESLTGLVSKISSAATIAFIKAALSRDGRSCIEHIDAWDQEGVDWEDVVESVATFCRHGFVVRGLGAMNPEIGMLDITPHEMQLLHDLAEAGKPFDLNRLFRTFMKCRTELTGSALDRFIFENYSLEWCLDPGFPDLEGLLSGVAPKISGAQNTSPKSPQTSPHTAVSGPTGTTASIPSAGKTNLMDQWKKNVRNREGESTAVVDPKSPQSSETKPPATSSPAFVEDPRVAPSVKTMEVSSPTVSPIQASPVPEDDVITPAAPLVPAEDRFPATWRDLVEQWKRQKPLQARIMEEAYLVEYSPQRIVVAADPQSLAAAKLLQPDIQKKVVEQLALMFGFQGEFRGIPREKRADQDSSRCDPSPARGEYANVISGAMAEESLLDTRRRESEMEKKKILTDVTNHPLTQEAVKLFGGTIESVQLND